MLEAQAVKQGSHEQYLREWTELLHRINLTADQASAHSGNDLDSIIVQHFEKLFLEGPADAGNEYLGRSESFAAKILSTWRPRSRTPQPHETNPCGLSDTLNVLKCSKKQADIPEPR